MFIRAGSYYHKSLLVTKDYKLRFAFYLQLHKFPPFWLLYVNSVQQTWEFETVFSIVNHVRRGTQDTYLHTYTGLPRNGYTRSNSALFRIPVASQEALQCCWVTARPRWVQHPQGFPSRKYPWQPAGVDTASLSVTVATVMSHLKGDLIEVQSVTLIIISTDCLRVTVYHYCLTTQLWIIIE